MLHKNDDVDLHTAVRVRQSMSANRGDLIRLADLNFEIPGRGEPGLFALPIATETEGEIEWLLIEGASMNRLTSKTHIELLVKWVMRTYGDKASLTDCARGFLS